MLVKSPRAILFDLDNTLTNRTASIEAFAHRFHADFVARHQVAHQDELVPIMVDADGGGYRPLDDRWRFLQGAISWHIQPTTEELRDYWYQILGVCAIPADGLDLALGALKAKQIRLGIITNGPTILQNATLDCLKIRDYMDCIIVSETVGIRKPDPQIFQLALSQMELSASDVWYVGDHPNNDIIGAQSAGLTAIWIRGFHEWTDTTHQADYTIDDLAGLLKLIPD